MATEMSVGTSVDVVEGNRANGNQSVVYRAKIIRETATMWIVEHEHGGSQAKFRKGNLSRVPQCITSRYIKIPAGE